MKRNVSKYSIKTLKNKLKTTLRSTETKGANDRQTTKLLVERKNVDSIILEANLRFILFMVLSTNWKLITGTSKFLHKGKDQNNYYCTELALTQNIRFV